MENPSSRRVHWAFKLDRKQGARRVTGRKGMRFVDRNRVFIVIIGRRVNTQQQNDDVDPKDDHHHCQLSCKTGERLTKSAAIKLIRTKLNINPDIDSFRPLDDIAVHFIRMFPPQTGIKKGKFDQALQTSLTIIRDQNQIPTPEQLKKIIIEGYGIEFYTKNRQAFKEAVQTPSIMNPLRITSEPTEPTANIKSCCFILQTFTKIITSNIRKNGISTTHGILNNSEEKSQVATVITISLLPYFTNRIERNDNLPGLYFWGEPQSGKSYIFKPEFYRQISPETEGVSRYVKRNNTYALYLTCLAL